MVQITGFYQSAELTIIITGNKNNDGKIRIGVFSDAHDFKSKTNPVDSAVVMLSNGPGS